MSLTASFPVSSFWQCCRPYFAVIFSPLETISTSLWARLHHHVPVLSVFSHVRRHYMLVPGVEPSSFRPLPSFIDHLNIFGDQSSLVIVFQYCLFSVMSDVMSYLFMSSLVVACPLRLDRPLLLFPVHPFS